MKTSTKKNITKNVDGAKRPIDVYFEEYTIKLPAVGARILIALLLILFYFGLMGVCWVIPFPSFKWLGNYIAYINWASFFIAGIIYFWLKKSPVLSYFLLILTFIISYQVSRMQIYLAANAWIIYVSIAVVSGLILLSIFQKKHLALFKSLFMLPLWLISFPAKAIGVKI